MNLHRLLPCAVWLLVASTSAHAFYDPLVGRWLNRDPVEEPGHFSIRYGHSVPLGAEDGNLYVMVHNSPVERIDPLGLAENPWPMAGQVCNWCPETANTKVYILVEGQYFTLPSGQCTANKPGVGNSTDVDGVWVCPEGGQCQFNRINPGLVPFIACNSAPQNCPPWNGDPNSKNSPKRRGAPNNTPPGNPPPPTYRPPGASALP